MAITIREQNNPGKITLEPGGETMPFECGGNEIRLVLRRLNFHAVIVLEPT